MIIRVFIFISIVFSSNFEILSNSATFYIEDRVLKQPFLGGVNYPRIQWVDWDEDEYNRAIKNGDDVSTAWVMNKRANWKSSRLE